MRKSREQEAPPQHPEGREMFLHVGAHGHDSGRGLSLKRTTVALVVRWQGGGVVCQVRWGVIPRAADMPVAVAVAAIVAAVASASASETESGRRIAIAREVFCFFR